jgi:hypothetical protein
MENIDMDIAKTVKTNLSKFVPAALRKRYGRANGGAGFLPGMHVVVTGEDGDEVLARVVEQVGNMVRVELLEGGEIEEVTATAVRRAPRRRRAQSATIASEADGESGPVDAA